MTAETPAVWLARWFADKAPDRPLKPEENFFDAEVIDSFDVIELIEAIETTFAVRFAETDFQDRRFPTLAGLSAIVAEKIGAGGHG